MLFNSVVIGVHGRESHSHYPFGRVEQGCQRKPLEQERMSILRIKNEKEPNALAAGARRPYQEVKEKSANVGSCRS